jgi:hypothetical protein
MKNSLLPLTLFRFTAKILKCDLIVDGFPRSGTTYVTQAIRLGDPKMEIVSHAHGHGLVKLGIALDKKIFITYRNPIDSCASLMVREDFSAENTLKLYIMYYSFILRKLDKLCLIDFNLILSKDIHNFLALKGVSTCTDDKLIFSEVIKSEIRFSGTANPNSVSIPVADRRENLSNAKLELYKYPDLLSKATELFARLEQSKLS